MIYILNKQKKYLTKSYCWSAEARGESYKCSTQCFECQSVSAIKQYPILLEHWEGYEDNSEVQEEDIEFIIRTTFKEKSEDDSIYVSRIFESITGYAIPKQLSKHDKRIKDLEAALTHLLESIEKKYLGQAKLNAINIAKQILQNK